MIDHYPAPDACFPATERLPRQTVFIVTDDHSNPEQPRSSLHLLAAHPNPFPHGPIPLRTGTGIKPQGFAIGQQIGDQLTDNSYARDDFRLHDGWHLAIMTSLGISAVMRNHLGLKRRSDTRVDEVEDGGRAIVLEEAAVAFAAMHHAAARQSDGSTVIDNTAQIMQRLMQPVLPLGSPLRHDIQPWRDTTALGYRTMDQLTRLVGTHRKGESPILHAYVACDLDAQSLSVSSCQPDLV